MWHVDLRLTHFAPGFLVPLSSYPALVAGFLLLFVSIYTLTITTLAYRTPCTFLRLALALPTVLFFWNFGFGLSYDPPGAQVAVGMAVVGLYGIMRVLDTSVVSFLDVGPPLWVHTENGKPLPLPGTTKERLAYTFDLVTSLRGTSWFAGRHWEWAPTPLVRSPTVRLSRKTFLASAGPSLLGQYLLVDVLDSLNKSRSWDTTQRFPITSLCLPEQLVFSLSVCLGTVLSISVTYTLIASTAVALGSAPANWPPMFTSPFAACSLADFWARRWHAIFRRVFARLSLLSLALLPVPMSYTRTRAATRALTIFTLSAALHILLMYRLELVRPVHLSLARGGIGKRSVQRLENDCKFPVLAFGIECRGGCLL